ncbi:hypothetical protein ACWCPI_10705 [Streptomyces sp. NPDC001920]
MRDTRHVPLRITPAAPGDAKIAARWYPALAALLDADPGDTGDPGDPASWNGTLASGASTAFGFIARTQASTGAPYAAVTRTTRTA